MSNTDFALAVEDLTVSFDGFKAIDSLTLYIDRNELRLNSAIFAEFGVLELDAAAPALVLPADQQEQRRLRRRSGR